MTCRVLQGLYTTNIHIQSNLVKRDFFRRDFAPRGTFFDASTLLSQISLVMRDLPECKRDFQKSRPEADFSTVQRVFRGSQH